MYHAPHTGDRQAFRNANVKNLTAFGAAFQGRCRHRQLLGLLPECGFMDGGCLALALAVQQTLGRDLCQVQYVFAGNLTQHAVASLTLGGERVYLDGDGLASEADLLYKMRFIERVADDARVTFVSRAMAAADGLVLGEDYAAPLAAALAPFFARHPVGADWLAPARK